MLSESVLSSPTDSRQGRPVCQLRPLFINDLYEYNGHLHRLLQVYPSLNEAYAIRVDVKRARVQKLKLDELNRLAKDPKRLRVVEDLTFKRPQSERPKDVAVRNRRFARIKELVAPGILHSVLDRSTGWGVLCKHAKALKSKDLGCTPETLLNDLTTYFQGGQTEAALGGNYFRSGHIFASTKGADVFTEKSESGEETIVFAPATQRARGRNPDGKRYVPYACPPGLRQKILEIAWQHYKGGKHKSRPGAATVVYNELFALRDENGEVLRDDKDRAILPPEGRRPTRAQIYNWLRRSKPLSTVLKARLGRTNYLNNFAPRTGSYQDDTLGPGDVYEIDATQIDLWVVARAAKGKGSKVPWRRAILGKATLYTVSDRSSHLIVGFHISLENPSWDEAIYAILSIAGDWEALCKRLKVKYRADDWPAAGRMPNRWVGDRADMITGDSDALCEGVEGDLTNTVSWMAPDKAIAESNFICQHQPLRQHAPGYNPPESFRQRHAPKYAKDGCLTLDDLAAALLRIIIGFNRRQLRGYKPTPEQILTKSDLSPIGLFVDAIPRMGIGVRMPVEMLRRKLMRTSDDEVQANRAVVTEKGCRFKHCYFEVPKEWVVRAKALGYFSVKVQFVSSLADSIRIYEPNDSTKWFVAKNLDPKLAGYSFAEIYFLHKRLAEMRRVKLAEDEGHVVATYNDLLAIFDPAAEAARAANKGVPLGTRIAEGRAQRIIERNERRQEDYAIDAEHGPFSRIGQDEGDSVEEPSAAAATADEQAPSPADLDDAPRGGDEDSEDSDSLEPSDDELNYDDAVPRATGTSTTAPNLLLSVFDALQPSQPPSGAKQS
jgi:putative transposase